MPDRPHRRLNLTKPTATAATAPEPEREAKATEEKKTVRVMAYLTEEESESLDELWLRFRRRPEKPSKSDILRAAFFLAQSDPEALTSALASLTDTTVSRRDSKNA